MNFYVVMSLPMSLSFVSAFIFESIYSDEVQALFVYISFLTINLVISGVLCLFFSIRFTEVEKSIFSNPVPPKNLFAGVAIGVGSLLALAFLLSIDVDSCESGRCKSAGRLLGTEPNFTLLHGFSFFTTFVNQVFVARLGVALLSIGKR
jgi:magnesium-transporting ATPase (P-type)